MFMYIRSKVETVKQFATGKTVGKTVAMIIVSADNIPSFGKACQLAGMKKTANVWLSPSGREVSEENAYLSYN